ncbi:hypothetical protein EHP00_1772 [Ecytonucleospora hepatopenaei]|uniref:Uncharacterized protein n=1 Tax=Ecytonucleospora hepatopenaei TaxID=646526 RepID=A0A1W0E3L7_9MICR|nr:hypothetical protein EHP00_1772 [Ecytonucleospora hepatopenaei]
MNNVNEVDFKNMKEEMPKGFKKGFLLGESHELFANTIGPEVLEEIESKKCFVVMGKKKKGTKSWETLSNGSNPHANKQIYPVKKQTYYNWIVQRIGKDGNVQLEGPYVNKEMKNLLFQKKLEGTFIKRDCDACFLPFETVYEKYNNFIYEDTDLISKLYYESMEENTGEQVKLSECKKSYASTKVDTFLQNNKINGNCEEIVLLVRNKTRAYAMAILKEKFSLNEKRAGDLLNLLLAGAKKQLLVDVDMDGFTIQKTKNKQRK